MIDGAQQGLGLEVLAAVDLDGRKRSPPRARRPAPSPPAAPRQRRMRRPGRKAQLAGQPGAAPGPEQGRWGLRVRAPPAAMVRMDVPTFMTGHGRRDVPFLMMEGLDHGVGAVRAAEARLGHEAGAGGSP